MKHIKSIAKVIMVFLIFSCDNGLFDYSETDKKEYTQVTFNINQSSTDTRTIVPDLSDLDLTYEFSFTGPDTVGTTSQKSKSLTVSLANGDWVITIIAKDSQGNSVGEGQASFKAPRVDQVNIKLDLLETGNGSVAIDFDIMTPLGIDLSEINMSLTSLTNAVVYNLDVNESNGHYLGSHGVVPAGDYILLVKMTDTNGNNLNPYSEVVQVYGNIVTSSLKFLSQTHFSSIPLLPSNVTLTDRVEGLTLNWGDRATNETGYSIEKSSDGITFNTIEESLEIGSTSYIDKDVIDGNLYYYRIWVFNELGRGSSQVFSITRSDEIKVLYVKVDGTGTGTTWDDALSDVQVAIELSATYTRKPEVWIAKGTYHPNSSPNFPDETSYCFQHFSLLPGVAIYGGFVGSETKREQRDPWINETILSGDLYDDNELTGEGESMTYISNSYFLNTYHVIFHPKELALGPDTILDGFVIQGGYAWWRSGQMPTYYDSNGAGICNISNSMTFRNLVIRENISKNKGAGAYLGSYDGLMENVVFERNLGVLESRTNYTQSYGGGLYMTGSEATLQNILFVNNKADYGGAIYITGDNSTIQNVTFVKNHGVDDYGALYLSSASTLIKNSIFWNNTTGGSSKEIYLSDSVDVIFSNNVIDSFSSSVLFNTSKPHGRWTSILTGNPIFEDIDNPSGSDNIWFTTDDGLIPSAGGSAIETGIVSSETLNAPTKDVLGSKRLQGRATDLGPYESTITDNTAPSPVSNFTVTPMNSSLLLSWNTPLNNDFNGVSITWTPEDGVSQPLFIGANSNETIITGLKNGTNYTFTIKALDCVSNYSNSLSKTGTPQSSVIPEVSAPRVLSSNKTVNLSWSPPSDFLVKRYIVKWATDDGDYKSQIFDAETSEYVLTGLKNDIEYYISIHVVSFGDEISNGFSTTVFPSKIIYLKPENSGRGDGSSWDNAINDLGYATENCSEGTEIWVSKGTYIPTSWPNMLDKSDPKDRHFSLRNGMEIYGGFLGVETQREDRDPFTNETILSGDINGDDVYSGTTITNNLDNLYHVFLLTEDLSLDGSPLLDGFVISGGNAEFTGDYFPYDGEGQGAAIYSDTNDFRISNTVLRYNSAGYDGGAIYTENGTLMLDNSIIENNVAVYFGGGISTTGTLNVQNSIFIGNSAGESGGAMYLDGSYGYIRNSIIYGNSVDFTGGGVYSYYARAEFYNNIFALNTVIDENGFGTDVYIYNSNSNTWINNLMDNDSYQQIIENESYKSIVLNMVTGSPSFVGTTPIGADGIWFTPDDELMLSSNSLGIDSGVDSYGPYDLQDLDRDGDIKELSVYDVLGASRIQGGFIDLGPYESSYSDTLAPGEVTGNIVEVAGTTATISWTNPTDLDLNYVYISWTSVGGDSGSFEVGHGIETAEIEGLIDGDDYTFLIQTKDFSGNTSTGI